MPSTDAAPQPLVRTEAAIALSILAFVFVVVPVAMLVWATVPRPERVLVPMVLVGALLRVLHITARSLSR